MEKIFVSYRRKESADFTGRLFDRLTGFFGSDRVYMDVDDLIAGKDYREQIGEIIDQCDVLLAIVGEQWVDIRDDNGQRRLLNEDDQLRIEIESAIELRKTVIPILIHGATQPNAEQIPTSISAIADLPAVEIQSGLPFNADVKKLIDVLQNQHGLSHPDKRFPLEMILIPLGIILIAIGVSSFSSFPPMLRYLQAEIPAFQAENVTFSGDSELPPYQETFWEAFRWCSIPLFFGPLLIVAGKRWCCLTKDATARRLHFSSGVGRTAPPKNAKSIYSFATGLTALSIGALAIIPAFVFGIWALYETHRRQTWIRGRSLAVAGMLLSLGGIFITWGVHAPMVRNYGWYERFERAKSLVQNEEYDEAVGIFEEMSLQYQGRDDLTSFADLARAKTLLQSGNVEDGMQALAELVGKDFDADPRNGDIPLYVLREAHETRASIFESQGDFARARQERDAKNQVGQVVPDEDDVQYTYPGGYGREQPPAEEAAPIPPAPVVDPSATNTTTEDVPDQAPFPTLSASTASPPGEESPSQAARLRSSTSIPDPFALAPDSLPVEMPPAESSSSQKNK